MNKQEILRKHLGQTPAEFQDLGKKNTLDAMEEYAELYHQSKVKTLGLSSIITMLPSDDEIEANGIEGGLRDRELQLFWEGGTWLKNHLLKLIR